jgi:hypothetical protein
MSDQEREREHVDEPQEDMELPDEQSEDVKGGIISKDSSKLGSEQKKDKWDW